MNLGNWLTPASQAVTGYLQGQQQKQQADQQAALQQYAMKRQQEQDDLRQQLETRQRDQQDQNMQLQAAIHGLTPQGTPSRINPKLNAVPLPESPTVTQDSDSSNADPIAGASQRQAELQSQDTPGITIGTQRFGMPSVSPKEAKAPTYNKDQAITTRVRELVGQGVPLDQANTQARLEHGETNPAAVEHNPIIGSKEWLAAEEAKAKIGAKYRTPAIQVMTDGSGNVVRIPKIGGAATAVMGPDGKPLHGKMGAGAGDPGFATTAVANLDDAEPRMQAFEEKARANPALYNAVTQAQGALGNSLKSQQANGIWGAWTAFLSTSAASNLDEEAKQYLQDKMVVADAYTQLHKRPNLTNLEAAQLFSGMTGVPSDLTITAARKFRANTHKGWEARLPQGGTGEASGGGAPDAPVQTKKTVPDQAAYDELRKSLTAAQIAARYNLATGITAR